MRGRGAQTASYAGAGERTGRPRRGGRSHHCHGAWSTPAAGARSRDGNPPRGLGCFSGGKRGQGKGGWAVLQGDQQANTGFAVWCFALGVVPPSEPCLRCRTWLAAPWRYHRGRRSRERSVKAEILSVPTSGTTRGGVVFELRLISFETNRKIRTGFGKKTKDCR